MVTLIKFLRWLFQKVAAALLMAVLALCAYGLWLFLKDNVDFDLHRNEVVMALTGERAHLKQAMGDVEKRLDRISDSILAERDRLAQEGKVIAQLKDLDSTWDRYVGNPDQQKANDAQLARMQKMKADSEAKVAQLHEQFKRATWEKDGLEVALGRLDDKIRTVDAQKSKVAHYGFAAWMKIRWWLLGALLLYFLGPTVGKGFMYYALAPLIMRGRPVRLSADGTAMPEVGPSHVSLDLAVGETERLWIREKFLQASDEGLQKRTRFLLDWRIPFTCLASGLVELNEMKPAAAAGVQHATLSNQANPHIELALVALPPGAALVLRPSFLAGAAVAQGQRLRIRRRWQIFRWQAWVTLQFRFFEFAGPCRLIVAGSRGVRAERLVERAGAGTPARRTNQDATIGFTPNLDYKPVRAETFWSYYRGMNPLFDDLFAGRGVFLCQEISMEGAAGRARKFWAGLWGAMLKAFGL
jgi:hypothetical protein